MANNNIIDKVVQYPGSVGMNALEGVINTAKNEQGVTGDVARKFVGGLEKAAGPAEKLSVPYSTIVSRPLSTFLQTVKDYGKSDRSLRETWDESWKRAAHVSPLQAGVGVIARFTPGQQGADKINWADEWQVKGFFEKDNTAAERITGAGDAVLNFFLDPLVFVGKGAKLARLAALGVRGTKAKGKIPFMNKSNLSSLLDELDAAEAGAKNGASEVVDAIMRNKDDAIKMESLPIVANSSNPVAVGRALSYAANGNDIGQVYDFLRVGLGDLKTFEKINKRDASLADQIASLRGDAKSIKNQLDELNSTQRSLLDKPKLTKKELDALESTKNDILAIEEKKKALKELNLKLKSERKSISSAVTEDIEGGILGKVGMEIAWSRRRKLEYLRNKASELNGRGYFTEIDPTADSRFARAAHSLSKEGVSNSAMRSLRSVGYFGRGYKAKEIPAGSVVIAGEVGDASVKEFRARLLVAAKEARLSASDQSKEYTNYSRLLTDSQRFNYLEDFETRMLERMLKNQFDVKGLNYRQLETLDETVKYLARDIKGTKGSFINNVINEKNYVHIDERTGKEVILRELQDSVDNLAASIARSEGVDVAKKHTDLAKKLLTEVPQTRTQVPNVHYGVNFEELGNILRDDKTFITSIIATIKRNPDITKREITNILEDSKAIGKSEGPGIVGGAKELVGKTIDYNLVPMYEGFQNFIWKPAVLLSLRYTSRNTLENWGRMGAAFADMSTHFGYSLSTLLKGMGVGEAAIAPIRSGTRRLSSVVQRKGLLGTGGAKRQERMLLAQKIENEVEIGRNFGITTDDDGITAVIKIADRFRIEGEHFFKSSKDVLSVSVEAAKQNFNYFAQYRGPANLTKLAKDINKIGTQVFKFEGGKKVSSQFLNAMIDGNYELAYKISVASDPEVIFNSLEAVSRRSDDALKQIDEMTAGLDLARTPQLQMQVERVQELLQLVKNNSDVAKVAFDTDNRIRIMADYNKALSVPRSGPEKITAYSEKPVKVSKNATIPAPFSLTMRRETVSSANSSSRAVLDARRTTLSNIFSSGRKQSIVDPVDDAWSSAHSEYINNILYSDDAGKFIIETTLKVRAADNPGILDDTAKLAKMKPGAARNKFIDSMKQKYNSATVDEVVDLLKNNANDAQLSDFFNGRYSDFEVKQSLMKWLDSKDANKWRAEKLVDLQKYGKEGFRGAELSDFTNTIFDEVNRYLPMEGPSGEDMSFLRKALVDGNFDETTSARIPSGYRESVYANLEMRSTGNFKVAYKNVIGNLFHLLATLPEDYLARHPFYSAVYRAEGERVAELFASQGKDVQKYSTQIANAAHAAAYKATVDRLYTVERHTNIGHMLRWFSPFYMAQQNSAKFWVGTAIRNPEVAYRYIQAFTMPYKIGEVKNRDDNYKVVNQIGHPWNTKGMVMTFDYPKWMVDKFFAGDSNARMEIPLSGFDVAFQGQPIGVPTIGSPAASLFLGTIVRNMSGKSYDPTKFTEKFGFTLEQALNVIQPYYNATRGAGVLEQTMQSFGGGSVAMENALIAIGGMAGQFETVGAGQKFANRVKAIEADKLARLADSGQPITGAIIEQTREESVSLAIKSFWAESFSAFMPLITTMRYRTQAELTLEPEIRRLRSEFGYELGTAKAVEKLDSQQGQYIVNLITDSNIDNRFGLNASQATLAGIYPNQDLMSRADQMLADSSLMGVFFNQGDFTKDYSDIAADIMYNININGKPIKYAATDRFTSEQDLQVRSGNREYYKGIETIENDARMRGIKKGTQQYNEVYGAWKEAWKAQVAATYPVWAASEKKLNLNRVERNLAAVKLIVTNSKYMETIGNNSDMAKAMKEYLRGREQLVVELEKAKAISGNKTLSAANNSYVAEMRDAFVSALNSKYPGFQRVFDIYFNDDQLNDFSIYETGYGFEGLQ